MSNFSASTFNQQDAESATPAGLLADVVHALAKADALGLDMVAIALDNARVLLADMVADDSQTDLPAND